MEISKKYEKIIVNFLNDYLERYHANEKSLKAGLVIDRNAKKYIVSYTGWENENEFVYMILFHIEIRNGKIWLLRNITEIPIDLELLKRGIPKKDMWIASNPDYANHYAGYGVDETELVEN